MASAATPAIQNFLMRTSIGKRPLKDERASLPNQLTVWTGIPVLPRCNVVWASLACDGITTEALLFSLTRFPHANRYPLRLRGRLSLENALEHPERARQPQRDLRHVGDDAEEDQHGQKPRPHRDRQFGDTHLGDAGSNIQIEADRRMAHADFHVDHHQDAEMHRMDA